MKAAVALLIVCIIFAHGQGSAATDAVSMDTQAAGGTKPAFAAFPGRIL